MHTLKNDSVLSTLLEHESEARFSKIIFTDDQILKILRALHINKAYGHDKILIRINHSTPLHIVSELCWYKDFVRHLEDTCLQKRWQADSLIIIDQSPCYPFLERVLKGLFSIQFFCILKRIIYFVLIRQGSDLLILGNINFSQYCMKFINLLIVIYQKMSGVFS